MCSRRPSLCFTSFALDGDRERAWPSALGKASQRRGPWPGGAQGSPQEGSWAWQLSSARGQARAAPLPTRRPPRRTRPGGRRHVLLSSADVHGNLEGSVPFMGTREHAVPGTGHLPATCQRLTAGERTGQAAGKAPAKQPAGGGGHFRPRGTAGAGGSSRGSGGQTLKPPPPGWPPGDLPLLLLSSGVPVLWGHLPAQGSEA